MKKGLKQIVSILLCFVMMLTNIQLIYAVDSETNTTDNNNVVNSTDAVSGSAINADVKSNDDMVLNEKPKAILYKDGTLVLYTTSDIDKTNYSCIFDDISKLHLRTYANSIYKVIVKDKISLLDYSNFFADFRYLKKIENIENLDISQATDLRGMFADCSSLESLDLSSFDTSNVIYFSGMFRNCHNLKTINLSNFNTSSAISFVCMFADCRSLKSLDLSSFDTSNATDFSEMFYDCYAIKTLDLSSFDTSNATDFSEMFNHCTSITTLDLSSFDTKNVTKMESMFSYCFKLKSIDISHFNTSKVTNMNNLFSSCNGLNYLDVSNFDTTNVTEFLNMFYDCSNLKEIKGLENWNTAKSVNYNHMFRNCSSLVNLNLSTFFANSNPISYNNMLDGTSIKTLTVNPSRISENLLKYLPDVTYKVNSKYVKNTGLYDEIKNETGTVDILGPCTVTFLDTKTKKHMDEIVYYDTVFSDINNDLENYFKHSDDFVGWYKTLLNNTKPLENNDCVATNNIYYGLYSEDTYTITYKYDGQEKKQVVAYDTTTKLFDNIFDKDESILIGWTDGTNDYTLGQKVKNLGNIVLEPKWGSLSDYCKITFDYNDGTNRTRIEYVKKYKYYKNTVEYVDRDGYSFIGWFDSTDNLLDDDYEIIEDTIFYAKYTKGISLTFKDDYNSLNNCSYTVEKNSYVRDYVPKIKQSKSGKIFLGWSLDKQNIIDADYEITEDTILYAVYTYRPVLDNETIAYAAFEGQDSNLYELTESNFPAFQSSTLSLDGLL